MQVPLRMIALWLLLALAVGRAEAVPTDQVLGEVLRLAEREHVDAGQVSTRALLEGALQTVVAQYPQADRTVRFEAGRFWLELRAGGRSLVLHGPQATSFSGLEHVLTRTVEFLEENLRPRPLPEKILTALTNGLLSRLDSRSQLLSPEQHARFQDNLTGKTQGTGLLLHRKAGWLVVRGIMPGSPAAGRAMRVGSRLELIDFFPARNLSIHEAELLLRGGAGTSVTIHVRPGEGGPLTKITLNRARFPVASVGSHLFEEGAERWIGYLRVSEFQGSTSEEVGHHLSRMHPERAGFFGIVLDLRRNPGGVMEEAISTADKFLDRGEIVTLVRTRGNATRMQARGYGGVTATPMIVLVDQHTASGAEIVASALADNRRALVVGARTVGKGSVQSVIPLSAGFAVSLTVARLISPQGQAIQGVGVPPQLELIPVSIPEKGAGFHFGPIPLEEEGGPFSATLARMPYLEAGGEPGMPLPSNVRSRDQFLSSDFPVRLARQILVFNQGRGYPSLVRNALEVLRATKVNEQRRIAGALTQRGIDWSEGNRLEEGRAHITELLLETQTGQKGDWRTAERPMEGRRARVTLSVVNMGHQPLHRLLGRLSGDEDFLGAFDIPFGVVPPGQKRSTSVEIDLPPDLPGGVQRLQAELRDQTGRLLHQAALVLAVQSRPPPVLRVSARRVGTENGGLKVDIHNVGTGTSGPLQVAVTVRQGESVKGRFQSPLLRPLAGGAKQSIYLHGNFTTGGGKQGSFLLLVTDREHPGASVLKALAVLEETSLQKPSIELQPLRLKESDITVELAGQALDDKRVESLTVLLNGRRVLHLLNQDTLPSAPLPFRVVAHLREGKNEILIESRDGEQLATNRRLILWRGNRRDLAGDSWFQELR